MFLQTPRLMKKHLTLQSTSFENKQCIKTKLFLPFESPSLTISLWNASFEQITVFVIP
ncbi:hypothetical protein J2S74_000075 [Evansella vedderi]|uniref:Uncharacterized protein n=1 Tax=Evansella vedderi TaxID=38282 RepID=A0ABT9ZN90_9BACI|nr:hypothetical protein [Evansella vedderi]